jgi:inner membrane protein
MARYLSLMLFRTHILFGVLVFFVLARFVEMPFWVLGFVLLGAVFVDFDSSSSKLGKEFWLFNWWMRHRGMIHSLFFCVLVSLIVGFFSRWAGFGFFVGYLSHLMLDSFTRMGVGLFWPFGFRVKGFMRSGSWMEDVVFVLLLFVDIWFAFNYLL